MLAKVLSFPRYDTEDITNGNFIDNRFDEKS